MLISQLIENHDTVIRQKTLANSITTDMHAGIEDALANEIMMRGVVQAANQAQLEAQAGDNTRLVLLDNAGLFKWVAVGVPNGVSSFASADGGIWLRVLAHADLPDYVFSNGLGPQFGDDFNIGLVAGDHSIPSGVFHLSQGDVDTYSMFELFGGSANFQAFAFVDGVREVQIMNGAFHGEVNGVYEEVGWIDAYDWTADKGTSIKVWPDLVRIANNGFMQPDASTWMELSDGHIQLRAYNAATTSSTYGRIDLWGLTGDNIDIQLDAKFSPTKRTLLELYSDAGETFAMFFFSGAGDDARLIMDGTTTWQWQLENLEQGTSDYVLYWNSDPFNPYVTVGPAPSGGGGGLSNANSGLHLSSTTAQLGGALLANTTITNGAFLFDITGSGTYAAKITNSGSGYALQLSATTQSALLINSTTAVGVQIVSNTQTGTFQRSDTNNASMQSVFTLVHSVSSGPAAANGIGGAIQYNLATTTSSAMAGRHGYQWTDAVTATRTSQFELYVQNSAAEVLALSIKGTGQHRFNRYGTNIFAGSPAYALGVDPSGNLIEFTPAGGGGMVNPMTNAGDIIIGGVSGAAARLGAGANGYVLTMVGGSPAWASPTGGGGDTSGWEYIGHYNTNQIFSIDWLTYMREIALYSNTAGSITVKIGTTIGGAEFATVVVPPLTFITVDLSTWTPTSIGVTLYYTFTGTFGANYMRIWHKFETATFGVIP
jgi:hypothetical protein